MKNGFVILSTLMLILMLIPLNAYADIIVPGTKRVGYCYGISNLDDYPDHAFILNEPIMTGHKIFNKGDCFSFYHGMPRIYAIKKSGFNESELNEEFFSENNTKLIGSDIELYSNLLVDLNDPLGGIHIFLEVVSLDQESLEFQKSKVIYSYTDGTSEEVEFESQDVMPERSRKLMFPWWFANLFYIIIPILAIIVIAAILLRRRSRKRTP